MQDWQQRVVDEKIQLDIKIKSLSQYFSTPAFENLDELEQNLLDSQWTHMVDYSNTLNTRILYFKS